MTLEPDTDEIVMPPAPPPDRVIIGTLAFFAILIAFISGIAVDEHRFIAGVILLGAFVCLVAAVAVGLSPPERPER